MAIFAQTTSTLCGVWIIRVVVRCVSFLVEFVRMPDNGVYVAFGWLTRGQILSLPLIVIGLFLFWLSCRSPVLQPVPAPEVAK